MSLVTSCPACATTFKVVRDQLRISDGWVRCGRCSQVFDANEDLRETPDPAGATEALASSGVREETGPSDSPVQGDAGDDDHGEAMRAASREADDVFRNDAGTRDQPQEVKVKGEGDSDADADADADANSSVLDEQAGPRNWVDDDDEFNDDIPSSDDVVEPRLSVNPQADDGLVPASPAPRMSLAALFADTSWPDRVAMSPVQDAPAIPSYKSFPPFPSIDLSLPPAPLTKRFTHIPHPDSSMQPPASEPEPEPELGAASPPSDLDGMQLQKALRRARAKSAKIARYKAREALREQASSAPQRSTGGSASMVMSASETDVELHTAPVVRAPVARRRLRTWGLRGRLGSRRGLWLGAAVLSSALLVLQVLRFQRDVIAAYQPSWKPLLAALCSATGCELTALRRIGDIKIDGASFSRERTGDAYRLSFTLRNVSGVEMAMPSIELSLLDLQERAVVRRVLMPAEYGAPATLAPHGERSASLPLSLTGPDAAGLPPVAGFLVEALYP